MHKAGPRETVGAEIGALSDKKGIAYGDSISATKDMMSRLYPNGISVEQFETSLIIVRILDKLNRIANGKLDAFQEDPWADIAGYSILMICRGRSECI